MEFPLRRSALSNSLVLLGRLPPALDPIAPHENETRDTGGLAGRGFPTGDLAALERKRWNTRALWWMSSAS
eukprot:scaffold29_cov251-Pinguiococcus_pyrenoidosus.AAC.6